MSRIHFLSRVCLIPAVHLGLCLATTGLLVLSCKAAPAFAQGKKQHDGPALVRTDRVTLKPRQTSQSFVGSLQPVKRSVIGSAVEERVENVFFEEGDFVEIDAADPDGSPVLVQLRRDSIDLELASSRIELELREKALTQLSTTIPIEIESAKAEMARISAELDYARQVYDRTKGLGKSMSQKETEESASLFRVASQSLIKAQSDLTRLETTREIRLSIARQNVQRQQAELDRVLDLQSRHSVLAPFSGYVTARFVETGTWVTRGTPLVELVQLDPIELRIQIPQEYSAKLQQTFDNSSPESPLIASITIDSIEKPLTGTVERIVPDADPRTRTIPVIIRISNPASSRGSHLLKPGLLARANINIGLGQPVLMVPKDALVLNQGRAAIYIVDHSAEKSTVRREPVETGNSNGNWIEVTGNVANGNEVVVQGNERLRNGESIRVLESPSGAARQSSR